MESGGDQSERKPNALFTAVWEGEDMVVRSFLKEIGDLHGESMRKAVVDGMMNSTLGGVFHPSSTPLFIAAHYGKDKCVTELIDNGADPNKLSAGGGALHAAAEQGHTNCVEALIKGGADLEMMDWLGSNALHSAVKASEVDCVEMLLAYGAEVNATILGKTQTALHIAMVQDSFRDKMKIEAPKEIIEVLLKAGADPTLKGGELNTDTGWSGSDDQLVAHIGKD